MLAALLFGTMLLQAERPGERAAAQEAIRLAIAAVEGDSVFVVERMWERRPEGDRAARLGLATLARLTYRHARADSLYAQLLPAGAPPDAYTVEALIGSGSGRAERSEWRSADSLFGEAMVRARATGDSVLQVDALLASAQTQLRSSGVLAALALVERADSLLPGDDAEGRMRVQCVRASVDAGRGLPRARLAADSGAAGARRLGRRRTESFCERIVASAIEQLGFADSAIKHLGKVERLERQTHDRAGLAATLQWRGWMRLNAGDFAGGRRDLSEAIAEGEASANRSPVAWAHLALATLALALSDETTAAAETELARIMFVAQSDVWGQINILSLQARLAWRSGDLGRMRDASLRYRDGAERMGGLWRVEALRLTGLLAEAEGDRAAAFARLDSALFQSRQLLMQGRALSVESDLARLEMSSGRVSAAKSRLQHALAVTRQEPHPYRYDSRVALAAAFLAEGDADGAEASVRAAMDTLERWRAATSDREVRRAAFSLADDRPGEVDLPAVLAGLVRAGRARVAFEFAERRRARMLLDQLALLAHADTAPPSSVRGQALPLAALQQSLSDGRTAVLEFVSGESGSEVTGFLLTRDTVDATVLAPLADLVEDITRLQSLVEAGQPADAVATGLGEALLASLISRLPPGIARLVIVPDRGLHGIPWDLLRLRDGRALVERYAVSLASSASVLARLVSRPRRDAPVSVLAFGAPRWPDLEHGAPETAALRAAVRAQGGLAALPAALEEARRLRRRAPAGDVRTGRAASEASLKRQPAGYRILHFATHAVVDDRSIERTALALAPGDGDDGFLLPAELARLPLDADLFALVACRTARGPVAGSEGVQGLAYAALEAGARSVLASEWSVSDDASAAFVDAFYSAIASGLDTGEALVRAKREALAAGRPARDWAAFTLIGDPYVRLALGEPANGAPITILAVSAVLVLAAGYGVMMRRRHSELMREPSTRKASTRH